MNKKLERTDNLLIPFWERQKAKDIGFLKDKNTKKIIFYLKIFFYSFSGLMIFWSFIQSFAAPWTNYNPKHGVGLEFGFIPYSSGYEYDYEFFLSPWTLDMPKYSPFWRPRTYLGPFLSWFVYPVAYVFIRLIWAFKQCSALKNTGFHVILSMLILVFFMRFITFWPTLRASLYQEKQSLHQAKIDLISAKYDRYDPSDKQAKLRKHQEITNYNKKYGLKPFVIFENFFINTPIFLIVFKLITITRPIKFAKLFGILELSSVPSTEIFKHLTESGWHYLILCLVVIPVNLLSQRIASWLSKLRNPSLKKQVVNKNSQNYKMQRIQKMMSLFFLFFTFFWSTGLVIYYFFNSLFTILQNVIIHYILIKRKSRFNSAQFKLERLGINA